MAPVAGFIVDKTSGDNPLTVQFNDTSSGGAPTAWYWNFGNGTWFNTTDPLARNASYTYSAAGTYTAQLTVSNIAGENTTIPGITITVSEPVVAPVAAFSANQTSGERPLSVQFTDISTGGTPTAWNWSFGDGNWFNTSDSSEKNAPYTYTIAGNYTAKLLISNSAGGNITVPGTLIRVGETFTVQSITPSSGSNSVSVQANITGTILTTAASVALTNGTFSIPGSITSQSSTSILCYLCLNRSTGQSVLSGCNED